MPASSLLDMSKRRLLRSIDQVVDVGDIPFHVVEPILKKIENPQQLRDIEATSPHIAEDTGPLWLNFIKRDIQNWEQKLHKPRDPVMWSKTYYKLRREQEEEIVKQQEALKAAIARKEQERKKNTSTLLGHAYDPIKQRRFHSTSAHSTSAPSMNRDPRNYTYMPGEAKKRLTGRGIMAKIQHQANASVSAKKSTSLMNVPTHMLSSRTKALSAPKSMVAEKSRAPPPIDRGKKAPSKASLPARPSPLAGDSIRKQRDEAEARLRALTSGTAAPVPTRGGIELQSRVHEHAHTPAVDSAGRPPKRKAETNCLMPSRKK